MLSEDELEQVSDLQELMPFTPDYCCKECSAALSKPIIRVFGYRIHGGAPMLSGEFRCPNHRWWNVGHTVLHLEYVGSNLDVFDNGKHFEKLWAHELDKRKEKAGDAARTNPGV